MSVSHQASGQRFIRSVHGSYLRVRLGYVDMGPHCQTCEHWHIEDRQGKMDFTIVFRAYCTPAKYLRANPDGMVDLANVALAWEEWTPVRNDNHDTWSFLSSHGTWLRADENGEVYLTQCSFADLPEDEQFKLGFWSTS